MLRYISKNKTIPAFFERVSANYAAYQAKIDLIKAVIQTGMIHGENQPAILSDPEAPLLLLYAIQQNLVPYWPGMTLHAYFVALAQFTDKQHLREDHMKDKAVKTHVKHKRDVIPVSLTEEVNGLTQISKAGLEYIDYQIYLYKVLGLQIDKVSLCHFILGMPDHIERMIFKVESYWVNYQKLDIDTSLREFRENVPFFKCRQQDYFVLPSFSLIQYFLRVTGDTPMQLMPFLGILNNETLHQYHLQNITPVSMYVKELVNYMMIVHGHSCGPFPLLVHDIGHAFWGTLLTGAERRIINHELMPFFASLKAKYPTSSAMEMLDKINSDLTDYDLTPITRYKEAGTRFVTYVVAMLNRCINNVNYAVSADYHDVDVLKDLRQLTCVKMTEENAHPFWLSLCVELDKTFKAILTPMVPDDSDTAVLSNAPTRQNSFFSRSNSEAESVQKKAKSDVSANLNALG